MSAWPFHVTKRPQCFLISAVLAHCYTGGGGLTRHAAPCINEHGLNPQYPTPADTAWSFQVRPDTQKIERSYEVTKLCGVEEKT